jgi:cytochrome P450
VTTTTEPRALVSALVSPEGRRDPYPLYEALRAHGDLVAVKSGLAVVVGYAACDEALREPRLLVQDAAAYDRVAPGWRAHASLRAYTDSMLYRNPPGHAPLRRLAATAFTPRRVEALREPIERLTDRLLDRLAELGAAGPVDFIPEFAARLPIAVISALLGVAERDQDWFRSVADRITIALEGITAADRLAVADAAMDELRAYFDDVIAHRRAHPADDVVGALVRARDDGADRNPGGGALSHDELIGNMMLMLTAGFETTSFLLGHALLVALLDPVLAGRLRAEPDFVAGYVEEVLRLEPPVQATSRWAGTDLTVRGHRVAEGTKLVVILAAGNRDPARFTEPHRFDPDRPPFVPLSFGAGAHFCLGAPLSRLEARIALPRLLRRFPGLAAGGEPVRRDTWIGRGLDRLPLFLG